MKWYNEAKLSDHLQRQGLSYPALISGSQSETPPPAKPPTYNIHLLRYDSSDRRLTVNSVLVSSCHWPPQDRDKAETFDREPCANMTSKIVNTNSPSHCDMFILRAVSDSILCPFIFLIVLMPGLFFLSYVTGWRTNGIGRCWGSFVLSSCVCFYVTSSPWI